MLAKEKVSGDRLTFGLLAVAALGLPVILIMKDLARSISVIANKMDTIINPVPREKT